MTTFTLPSRGRRTGVIVGVADHSVEVYHFKKTEREKMLFAIKNKFDNDPRLGNFYIWYHGVYEDSKKDASKMEQAIKDKFEAFGLKLS